MIRTCHGKRWRICGVKRVMRMDAEGRSRKGTQGGGGNLSHTRDIYCSMKQQAFPSENMTNIKTNNQHLICKTFS